MPKKSKKSKKPQHFLREWREYRELTQEELAQKVVPPTVASVISLLENGDRGLSNKWLERLAPALKTKKGFILDVNPFSAAASVLEIWGDIPEADQPQARAVLETFKRKAG